MDDFSARSDTRLEGEIFSVFEQEGIPMTLGVIPYICEGDVHVPGPREQVELPAEKLEILRQVTSRTGFEVAQHGCTHQVRAGLPFRSEFVGASTEAQLERIARGRDLLSRFTSVDTFIPPWNSYDQATLHALEALGFRCLSADRFGPRPERCRLQFLPSTVNLAGTLRAAEEGARTLAARRFVIPLFHSYDFRESGSHRSTLGLPDLAKILASLRRLAHVRFKTLGDCASVGGYDAQALQSARWRSKLARFLPPPLKSIFQPDGVGIASLSRTK